MAKVKITITVDETIKRLLKAQKGNISSYLEGLIKQDLFREQELNIYDSIVKRLVADGHISGGDKTNIPLNRGDSILREPIVVPDSQENW